MKNFQLLILYLIVSNITVYAQSAYYNQPITLKGKILIIKSLDDEQYSNAKYPAITLNEQLIVDSNNPNDDINQGQVKTKLLQLIDFDKNRYQKYYNADGRNVTVYCSELFRSHTVHHNTKVLCVVENIRWE